MRQITSTVIQLAAIGILFTTDVDLAEGAIGDTCEVTSNADSGPGTLRQCLLDAPPQPGGYLITFNTAIFPLGSPATIHVASDLPALVADNITINAYDAGVILDGSGTSNANGLTIHSDSNRIFGLDIVSFPSHGIYIDGSSILIGGEGIGRANVLTNNATGIGIAGSGSANNQIVGNIIDGCSTGILVTAGHDHGLSANHIETNDIGIRVESDATLDAIGVGSIDNWVRENTIGLSHAGSADGLRFECNWWNSADGPSGVGPGSGDSIEEVGTGTVDYAPWLTETGSACSSIIFTNGFESGDTSAWSNSVP